MNPAASLDRLLEALLEPVGRETRRRAAEAIRYAGGSRAAQRVRLSQLHDGLVAEGADGSKHLPELQRRADTWPE